MAYVIQSFVKRPRRYPWRQWADGRTWRVRPGVDFCCSIAGFRSAAYRYATRAELTVQVSVKAKFVEFRFVGGPAGDETPTSSDNTSSDNTSSDNTSSDKAPSHKTPSVKTTSDKTPSRKTSSGPRASRRASRGAKTSSPRAGGPKPRNAKAGSAPSDVRRQP